MENGVGPAWEEAPMRHGWYVPQGRYVELPGRGRTFVRELDGPPGAPTVVLLHGLGATAGLNWFASFRPLSAHYRVVALDHRGYGRGIRAKRFRLADCADDVAALTDVLGIDRFLAVGYSMGGPIAQLVWWRHRDRVDGLVLCATSRNFRGGVVDRVRFAGLGLLGVGLAVPGIATGSGRGWHAGTSLLAGRMPASLRGWALQELSGHDLRSVLQAAEAIGRFSSHDWIEGVDVPVGVVATTHDELVPLRRQLKMARSIPSAVLFPVEGDHMVVARSPGSFVPALVEACDQVTKRATGWPGGQALPALP
ncbi:MAG: alpha/beta fold hydrolase [Acidimicrobiia bacterium]|nr:alpha/beta fold hydrolase [Acidimicrobiia bacterium]